MSRKTFTGSMVVIAILGAMMMGILYIVLGRLQEVAAAKAGHSSAAAAKPAPPPGRTAMDSDISAQLAAQGIAETSLTPEGRSELERLAREQKSPPQPAPPVQSAQPAQPAPVSPNQQQGRTPR